MSFAIEVKNVTKRFGGVVAVDGCSLEVERGSITGLIGPNGAGKSTLFNILAAVYPADSGSVIFYEEDVTSFSSHALFGRGLLRTFQIPHEYCRLSCLENLMMVPGGQSGEQLRHAWCRPRAVAREERRVREKAGEVLEFLGLTHVRNELAGNLSGGQKKLLELGRTMMVEPKVVLLDEIGAGVNRTLLRGILDNIKRMNSELGYTFFLIEHDMDLITRLCDPVIVMTQGNVLTQGPIEEIKADPAVVEAYFGVDPLTADTP